MLTTIKPKTYFSPADARGFLFEIRRVLENIFFFAIFSIRVRGAAVLPKRRDRKLSVLSKGSFFFRLVFTDIFELYTTRARRFETTPQRRACPKYFLD